MDESKSLLDPDVDEEQLAAHLIVNGTSSSELDPTSEIAIVGFGSSDNPGQTAAVDRCPLAPVRGADVKCIDALHRRENIEGSGTDHTAAMRRALEIMSAPGGADLFKIIFFLTDGGLNVGNSPQYGGTEQARNTEAQRQLVENVLPEAKRAGIQIWPLGFGQAIDMDGLQTLADGGAGANPDCGPAGVARSPSVLVAQTWRKIGTTLLKAFSNAACTRIEDPVEGHLNSGATTELLVYVDPTAGSTSINVEKRHQDILVAYVDPRGRDVTNLEELDGSSFRLAGVGSPAESLWVSNPIPGTWTVRLSSPEGVPDQVVTATLLWKGRLRSLVTIEPTTPKPGESFVVRVQLLTSRYEPIADSALLADMQFHAFIRGDGFDPLQVPLADDGTDPDTRKDDAEFAGLVVLPRSASGKVSVAGSVTSLGFDPDIGSVETEVIPIPVPVDVGPRQPWYQHWYYYILLAAVTVSLFVFFRFRPLLKKFWSRLR